MVGVVCTRCTVSHEYSRMCSIESTVSSRFIRCRMITVIMNLLCEQIRMFVCLFVCLFVRVCCVCKYI